MGTFVVAARRCPWRSRVAAAVRVLIAKAIDGRIRSKPATTKAVTRAGRACLRCAAAMLAALVFIATDAHGFGFDDVTKRAEKLAGSAYQKPSGALPKALKALNYDGYRDIRPR